MATDHQDPERGLPPALEQRLAYQAIVDHSLQGLIIVQDRRVVFANGAMARISGYSIEEMLALSPERLRDFVHPLDRERIWEQHEARLQGASLLAPQEFRVIRQDGAIRWLQIQASRVEYDGRAAIQAACIDTTERRQMEEALQQAEQEKAIILNTMPQIVAYHDPSHRILWANRTALEALGRPAEEIVGRPCYELWEGASEPCEGCPVDRALRTGCSQETEIVGYNGGFWLVRGEPVRDAAGAVIGVVEMALDISRRKRDEEELRRRLQFEETIAGISTDFTNLRPDEIEAGIGRALAVVGRLLLADRSYLCLVQDRETRISRIHAWLADETDTRDDRMLHVGARVCSWVIEQFSQVEVLNIPRVADLVGQATPVRVALESIPVKSLLAVPVMIGRQLLGLLGVSTIREDRTWPEDAASLLKTVAEITANALERKRTADAMNERLVFETLLSDLSATFVSLPVDSIDREIERSLARMGEFLGLDHCMVLQFASVKAIVTHSWAAPGLEQSLPGGHEEVSEWSIEQLREGRILAYPRVEDMPAEAQQERASCLGAGVKSILAMPLEAASSMLGAVAFSSMRVQRDWPPELVQRLRLVGQIFANALLRRRAETALQASEEQFRSLFQNAVLGIYRTTPDGHILMANPSLVRILGYASFEEFAERNLEEQGLHPGHSWAAFRETIESQDQVVGLESTWVRRDGTPVFVRENARAVRGREGNVVCYEGTVEDITELKRAENALRASEQNYREIFNATNEGIFIHDPVTGRILDVNSAVLRRSGYSYDQALELTIRDLSLGESPYSEREALAWLHKAAHEGPQLFEWHARDRHNELYWEEVNLKSVTIGGRQRVLAVVRDITERKKAEAQARQHVAELARAWHANMLGEMASGLAHELNQPLCAIVNYSNGCLRLTRRKEYSIEVLQNSIEQIAAQAQRAADILKRIRGLIARREPQWTELDLDGILADAAQMLKTEVVEHNVTLISRCQSDLPKVKGDNVEIAQVVLNLMKNAIESMNDARITRRTLTISARRSHNREVEVAVEDTGRGVSSELSEKIFESFFTTKPQGLGIGLSLSRRIIETHGGRLWVEPTGRSGAAFRFTLPVEGGVHG